MPVNLSLTEQAPDTEHPYPHLRIESTTADYVYDLRGGGFASLKDRKGREWIGHSGKQGPSGEFRGIPNLYFRGPERGFFHPGNADTKASRTTWTQTSLERAVITSESVDGNMKLQWTLTPRIAFLEILRSNPADPGFWFLYEGTPGGAFQPEASLCIRSTGETTPLTESWEAPLPAHSWVAFTDPEQEQALLFWQEKADQVYPDSYFPMNPMTVFGFGRRLGSVDNLITSTPARFAVALAPADRDTLIGLVAEGVSPWILDPSSDTC